MNEAPKRRRSDSQSAGDEEEKTKCLKVEKADVKDELQVCFMDRLPNHLVLRIFQDLSIEDVAFLVPQVCKRWSHLAVQESLWVKVHMFYYSNMSKKRKMLFFKCMKMAPKIASITLEIECRDVFEFKENLFPEEVVSLEFTYDNLPPEAMFAMLKKYKNCLEKLTISDTFTPYDMKDVKRLWGEIQNLCKLEHLVIQGTALFSFKATFRKTAACWKTVKVLDVQECQYDDMNTVQKLITVNPNWTEIYLSTPSIELSREEVKALAKCSKLECVRFPFCREMKHILKCDKLLSIIMDCSATTMEEIPEVVAILSKNTPFPNLKDIKFINMSSKYKDLLLNLVKDHHNIRRLTLVSGEISGDIVQEILTNLPTLEILNFGEIEDAECISAVLKAVSNKVIPKLKMFSVNECCCDDEKELCIKVMLKKLQGQNSRIQVLEESTECLCDAPGEEESRGNEVENPDVNGCSESTQC